MSQLFGLLEPRDSYDSETEVKLSKKNVKVTARKLSFFFSLKRGQFKNMKKLWENIAAMITSNLMNEGLPYQIVSR